jgi:hypothetical protein
VQETSNQQLKTKNHSPFSIHLLVFLFYLAVTLVITYPLITVIGTRMIGHPFGDAYEYTHHIWWIKTALQTGQDPFFMPNLVYPDGVAAPLLWSIPLQSFPAWLFTFVMPLAPAFNISALLTLALNGWAMFFLARYLLRAQRAAPLQSAVSADDQQHAPMHPPPRHVVERGLGGEVSLFPALLAGLVFMLYPTFQGQLGAAHTGLLALYPAPLYLYCLLRLRDTPHLRRTILAGALLFMASLWGSILLLIYLVAPITALYFAMQLAARDWRTLRRALVTVVLGGLFALPFVVPLTLDTLQGELEEGSVRYSAPLLGVVAPSFYNPLFSGWEYNRTALGLDPFERASYVGVIAAVLALLALWKVRAARWWLLLALIVWVFSLGPLLKLGDEPFTLRIDGYATYVTLPWAYFQDLPLIRIARTPARFNFAVGFAVAIMAGYGAAVLLRSRNAGLSDRKMPVNGRSAVLVVLMLAIGFEYQFWWGLPTIPGEVPAPIAALAARDDIRAVFDIPAYHPLANKDGMFLQTGHQHPMIVGQVSRHSPADPAKVNVLEATLDPALLDAADIDIVILHRQYDGNDGAIGALARQQLGDPFYEDEQYAAFEVPPPESAPAFTVVPSDVTAISTQADSDVYVPEYGWVTFSADLTLPSSGGRDVTLMLDDEVIGRWTLGDDPLSITAPVPFGGFHRFSLVLNPPCPINLDPALECRTVELSNLSLNFTPYESGSSPFAEFERGVFLPSARIPPSAAPGEMLPVWLWWRFAEPLGVNDIRYVHVTDADGKVVAQQDNTLGVIAGGESRAEALQIPLPADLPAGEYTVSVGWYTYPDITNFCLMNDSACSRNPVRLGTVLVELSPS